MASQGPNSVSVAVSLDTSAGAVAWGTPGAIFTSNDAYASLANQGSASSPSDTLMGTKPGFTVPDGSTINGIVVEIEAASQTAPGTTFTTVSLSKDGATLVGNNNAASAAMTATDAYYTFGSPTDLWGTTWTPAEVTATTFGCGMTCSRSGTTANARVDHMRLTVYYTLPPPPDVDPMYRLLANANYRM